MESSSPSSSTDLEFQSVSRCSSPTMATGAVARYSVRKKKNTSDTAMAYWASAFAAQDHRMGRAAALVRRERGDVRKLLCRRNSIGGRISTTEVPEGPGRRRALGG